MITTRLTESELVAVLEKRSEAVPASEALKELNRRRSGKATKIMMGILGDTRYSADLRASAAVELGKSPGVSQRRALAAAVGSREPVVVRRAADALGRIGGEDALEALARLRPHRAEVRRSVAFARALISCRLGLNRYRLKPPAEDTLLKVRPNDAVKLRPRPVPAAELDDIAENLNRMLPAIPVSAEGALRFSCGENRFLIVFPLQLHRWRTLAPLTRRNAVVAVVLKRSQVLGGYYIYEYVLTDPVRDGGLKVYGVRPSGVMTHYGEADLKDSRTDAWLQTVDTPYTPPVDLQLSYEHPSRKLTFDVALLNPQPVAYQKRAKAPKRLMMPIG